MKRLSVLAASVAWLIVSPSSILSAQTTTGVMDGVVRGPDGNVLPGVRVVVNSPTLIQRDYTVYTDETGYYRLPLLLPGVYEVAFQLDGFQRSMQRDVIVRANQTTEQNAVLELAAVSETMLVTAEAPIIDSRAAKLAFTYTDELAEEVPVQRTVNRLFATIPGVESNNSYGNVNQPGVVDLQNVLGAGERSNEYVLDGASVSDPATQWNTQMMMPFDIIEEIQVIKSAKPAEVPYQGGLFNVITKSGSNELQGQIGAYFVDEALQGSNAQDIRQQQGVESTNEIVRGYEATASLGGRIVTDKVWWFASSRRIDDTSSILGFPKDIDNEITSFSGKVTYQANRDHRVVFNTTGWDQQVSNFFFGFPPALALDEFASSVRPVDGSTFGGRWSGILNENVLAEVGLSTTAQGYDQLEQPGANRPAVLDLGNGERSFNLGDGSRVVDNRNVNLAGSLSWYVPEVAGRHSFKFGFDYLPTHVEQTFDDFEDHRLHTLFGDSFAVRFLNTPATAVWDNDTISLFAQDAWSIGDRLTLNLGVRFAHRNVTTPETPAGGGVWEGTPIADRFPELTATVYDPLDLVQWTYAEPRFAMTFALDRAGRTVLRAGASRYHHIITAFDLFVATPAFPHNFVTLWFDNNSDDRFQIGEEGPLLFSFGGAINSVDPDLEPAFTNEFLLGVSHEATSDWQLNANFVYRKDRRLFNTVDVGVPFDTYTPTPYADPGPDGVEGTGDDATLTVFAQDPDTIGQNAYEITNPPGNDRTYYGLELTTSKRFSNNWQAVASAVFSELEVIKTTGSNEIAGVWDSPNNLINAEGLDPNNPPFQFKLQVTYAADFGLSTTAFYRVAAGSPYTRQLAVVGLPQGPFNVFAEPRGTSRTDTANVLDLRFEQGFRVGRGQLGLIVDVFNTFNSAAIVTRGTITGVNYGTAQAIQQPRAARIGLRYRF